MKKLNYATLLLFGASLLLASCGKTPEEPHLIVSADTLVFKGNQTCTLTVTTNNTERREFYAYSPCEWIRVNPTSGRVTEGETVELTLTSYLEDPLAVQEGTLFLTSAYDNKEVKLIGLPDDYSSYLLTDRLFFPENVNDAIMRISNYGNTTLDYSISASTSFISLSHTSGQLATMQSASINVSIDREHLLTVAHPALYVTIDGSVDTIPVVLEKKMMLPNDVVDAEYAKATDLLVYVSSDAKLNIYHPDTQEISTVALSYVPTCVSISPDGTKAVVGHDAHATYIDLMTATILTVNDITCDAFDIVLTDDGWTYVFPREDQWENIHYINVTNNNALEGYSTRSIYAGTKARLHPSGKYLFDAEPLSSASSEKFDIQDGEPRYITSSYYYDHTVDGDLWFEENGERMFCRSGNVFKTNDPHQDFAYNGSIALEGSYTSILWLDHLALRNEIYLVIQGYDWSYGMTYSPYVYVYNSDNLTYKTKFRIEDYVVNTNGENNVYTPSPCYVFARSNGAELYVITKADDSGMAHGWAIQTIDFE